MVDVVSFVVIEQMLIRKYISLVSDESVHYVHTYLLSLQQSTDIIVTDSVTLGNGIRYIVYSYIGSYH